MTTKRGPGRLYSGHGPHTNISPRQMRVASDGIQWIKSVKPQKAGSPETVWGPGMAERNAQNVSAIERERLSEIVLEHFQQEFSPLLLFGNTEKKDLERFIVTLTSKRP